MRARLGEDEEEDRRRPRIKTDVVDACKVERAWSTMPQGRDKEVLRLFYALKVTDPWRLCRYVGVRNRRDMQPFFSLIYSAQLAISVKLDCAEQVSYKPPQQSTLAVMAA
jgi:hypothetical protein